MSREDYRPVVRHLVKLVDEDRAETAQSLDDIAVVDDFMADVDGRSKPLECELDDLDRAVHSRAEATGGGDEDTKLGSVQHLERPCKPSLAGIEGPSYERAHTISHS